MSLVYLTRLILIVYAVGCFALLMRLISLFVAGQTRTLSDVGGLMIYPLLILTEPGRNRLKKILSIGS